VQLRAHFVGLRIVGGRPTREEKEQAQSSSSELLKLKSFSLFSFSFAKHALPKSNACAAQAGALARTYAQKRPRAAFLYFALSSAQSNAQRRGFFVCHDTFDFYNAQAAACLNGLRAWHQQKPRLYTLWHVFE